MKIEEAHSDKLKKFYDEKYENGYMNDNRYRIWSDTGAQPLRVKESLKHISIEPRKILDYGCGQGAWINVLSKMFPKAEIFGIDISDTAISKAKIQFPDCQFMTFNGTKAIFSNESFDVIYSYHVLEHCNDLKASITDIARMLKKGGYACIILPCANKNSLEEKLMSLMKDGKATSSGGCLVYSYEIPIGHLRRMASQEMINLFERNGFTLEKELYSQHFIGWIDWLVRAHYIRDINAVLYGRQPINSVAKIKLEITRKTLVALNWIVSKKFLDLSRRRTLAKKIVAPAIKNIGKTTDNLLMSLAFLEWYFFKHCRNGSEQFLVFKKS